VTYIDAAVLNGVERLCHLIQRWTGRTNVWLAIQLTNLSIVVYFVWAAGVYSWAGDFGTRLFIAVGCVALLYLLTQTIFKDSIEAHENSAYRRVAKGLRNPRRVRDLQLRISFLTLSVLMLWVSMAYRLVLEYVPLAYRVRPGGLNMHVQLILLSFVLILLTTAVLYLLACDPLPPCTGKVREWIGALTWKPRASSLEPQAHEPQATSLRPQAMSIKR
jgi:hypothetical protein